MTLKLAHEQYLQSQQALAAKQSKSQTIEQMKLQFQKQMNDFAQEKAEMVKKHE